MSKASRKQQARRSRSRRRNRFILRFLLPPVLVICLVGFYFAIQKSSPEPPLTGAKLIAKGDKVFLRVCAQCHGGDLNGSAMAPSFLDATFAPSQLPDASIRSAIKNGVQPHRANFGAMPPQPSVKGSEVDAVIAYIRSQQVAAGIGK